MADTEGGREGTALAGAGAQTALQGEKGRLWAAYLWQTNQQLDVCPGPNV